MKLKQILTSKRFISIVAITAFFAFILEFKMLYNEYCYPTLFKDFEQYNGIDFDYTLEEKDYKDKLYYKQLTESESVYYRSMYHAAKNGKNEYRLNFEINADDEFKARMAFGFDFPEYYWFGDDVIFNVDYITDGIGLFNYYYSSIASDCFRFGIYDIDKNSKIIEGKLSEILPKMKGENDYDTILNVYKYVIENTTYDYNYFNYSDIRSSFLFNKAVCSSYAESFQLICNRLGYECYSVQGKAIVEKANLASDDEEKNKSNFSQNTLHEWNIIRIDNNWYWVDPTWGDTYYYNLDDVKADIVDLTYFLSSDEIFFIDHLIDDTFEYPKCKDNSLYLANGKGIILDSFDASMVEAEVVKAFKNGNKDITFQFKSKEQSDLLIEWIDNRNIFTVYQNNISRYYQASMNYYQNGNNSVYIYWNFINL